MSCYCVYLLCNILLQNVIYYAKTFNLLALGCLFCILIIYFRIYIRT